jgi:hypothetical protein
LAGLATLVVVSFDISLSLDPDKYVFRSSDDRQRWAYVLESVAFVWLVMIAEAVARTLVRRMVGFMKTATARQACRGRRPLMRLCA